METGAVVAVGLAAMADWWSVWTDRDRVEAIAKPLVMLSLLAFVAVGPGESAVRLWVAVALLFGLLGDVLLLPMLDRFQFGLGAFLIGHLAYIGAAFARGTGEEPWLLVGAAAATVGIGLVGRRVADAVSRSELHVPVIAYVAVIGLMVTFLAGTGIPLVMLGAVLFAISDGVLGWTRFVDERTDFRWLVHVTYHAGQALLVYGLLT